MPLGIGDYKDQCFFSFFISNGWHFKQGIYLILGILVYSILLKLAQIVHIIVGINPIENEENLLHIMVKIYFEPFYPEPKGQLTRNFIGSIKVTCRSKVAKIILIGNPKWMNRKAN